MACIRDDIDSLPEKDQTIVGNNGISLSDSQKARIILARALYSSADFYIIDDTLSLIDEKIGKKIFR